MGVDRMYLAPFLESSVRSRAVEGRSDGNTNAQVCRLAAEAGVRHIVDMAGAKGDHWQVIEDGVEACGVPFTHLEPGEFMADAGIWAAPGRELTYLDLPHDQLIEALTPAMGEYAAWYADGLRQLAEHPQAAVPAVAELTGRPGTTFAAWARANTDLFQ